MALSRVTTRTLLAGSVTVEAHATTDISTTVEVLVASGSGHIRSLDMDNIANAGAISYFKIYDQAGTAVHGTDAPLHEFAVAGGERVVCNFSGDGLAYTLSLQIAVGLNSQLTAGNPASATNFGVTLT